MIPLFVEERGLFHPTERTPGPWYPEVLHGGAVAALCAELLEVDSDPAMISARLRIDFLRPALRGPLGLTDVSVRGGRRLEIRQAVLRAGEDVVAQCSLARLAAGSVDLPAGAELATDPPQDLPADLNSQLHPPQGWEVHGSFVGPGVEVRVDAATPARPGVRRAAWVRLLCPVVDERPPTSLARIASAADFGNGIGIPCPIEEARRVRFVNMDLDVRLTRAVEDEWVRISASATWTRRSVGLATTDISDLNGVIGAASQTIVLENSMEPSFGQIATAG